VARAADTHHIMLLSFARVARMATTAAAFGSIAACSGLLGGATETKTKTPASIVLVQGANQSVQAGKDLPTAIVFRVLDSAGAPLSGVTLSLAVVSGGGAVTPASDTTNGRGEFTSKWTLGPGVAQQTIVASVAGVTPLPVNAVGLLPTTLILVQGNNQTAKPGTALTNSIIVRVVGNANVPMQGVTVGFQVVTGGGGMTPNTVVTNALGEATTKWTLGAAGANAALVTSGSLQPIQLSATATP
jgi:hypothetical protein